MLPTEPTRSTALVTVAEMAEIERAADAAGHTYGAMMEMAGAAVAQHILARLSTPGPALILVGPGNNGGDGLVCAHHLMQAGVDVSLYVWRRPRALGDAEPLMQRLVRQGMQAWYQDEDEECDALVARLSVAAVIVDALLGTGSNRPIGGELAELLGHVRARLACANRPQVVAVDCPSGMNCDTGALDGHALVADSTVTFACAKVGHYKFPGVSACGELEVADIGIPTQVPLPATRSVLAETQIRRKLPQRHVNSHKGTFGKILLAVGSANYPGAATLATAAAGRAGAGLVTGALIEKIWPIAAGRLPEPTWLPLPAGSGDADGAIAAEAAPLIHQQLDGYSALVVGCGLGQAASTVDFVRALLASDRPPTLIDADGLNCLTRIDDWPALLRAETLLTPHAAEFSRLTGEPLETVLARRWELATHYAAAWGVVVLVKGPYTVIAAPDGALAVLPIATPALATAGTGDVLSGIIGGLMAQGLAVFDAACCGAWLHGQAGLLCEAEIGAAGVLASDLLERIPRVLGTVAGK